MFTFPAKNKGTVRYLEIKLKGVQGLNEDFIQADQRDFKNVSESTSKNLICYESYAVNGTTAKPNKKKGQQILKYKFKKIVHRSS